MGRPRVSGLAEGGAGLPSAPPSGFTGIPGVVMAEQPHYLPWIDFYELLARSGHIVVLDDVQWLRRGWQRRARVALPLGTPIPPATEPGFQWLTIPLHEPHRDARICDLAVDPRQPWAEEHLRQLHTLYGKQPLFRSQVLPELEPFYARSAARQGPGSLLAVLLDSMGLFVEEMGLKPRFVLSSGMDRSHPDKTGRLVSLCQQLDAHTYYTGIGSIPYLKVGQFRDANLRLLWQKFRPPTYPQGREGRFVHGMSIVDVLSFVPMAELRRCLEPSPWGPFSPEALAQLGQR